jgi:hypothetical protein
MIHRFRCEPIVPDIAAGPLVLDWDDETGAVTGPGAAHVRRWQRAGIVPLHPWAGSHVLARGPLQSRADLAAIIGIDHRLPEELAADYPAPIDATDDDPTIDELAAIFPDGLPDAGDKSPATQTLAAVLY